MPMFPFVQPAQENAYAGGPDLSAFESLIGTLQQALQGVDARPAPEQMAVPGATNPLASMAALFSGTLADQLGARGTAQSVRDQLAMTEAERAQAIQQNRLTQQADFVQRQKDRLGLLQQIAEAKLAQAKEMGDWKLAEAAAKQASSLEKEKFKNDKDLEQLRADTQMKVARIYREPKEKEAAGAEELSPEKIDDRVLRFTDQIESIAGAKGSTSKGFLGFGGTQLKPEVKQRIQERSFATAKNAALPQLRDAALSYYLDTLRDKDGRLDPEAPGAKRFRSLLKQLLPDPDAWLEAAGALPE